MIFGIGVGLFIILSLWVLAALIFVISLRIEKKIGAIAILLVSALTIILISVPRASEKSILRENTVIINFIEKFYSTFNQFSILVLFFVP